MNIAQALPAVERDTAAPAGNGAHARKGEAPGDAFERAVRSAGHHPSPEKAAKNGEDGASTADEAGEAEAADAPAGEDPAPSPADVLTRLLGAFSAPATPGDPCLAAADGAASQASPVRLAETGEPLLPGAVRTADVLDGLGRLAGLSEPGSAPPAVRLDILGLETHFEPRSDDFVLVEGRADAKAMQLEAPPASAAPGRAGQPAATAGDHLLRHLVSEPVVSEPLVAGRLPAASAQKPAGRDEAARLDAAPDADGLAEPRLRFGEALARLGRSGEEPSGGRQSGAPAAGRDAAAPVKDASLAATDKAPAFVPTVAAQLAERIVGVLGAPGEARANNASPSEPFLRLRAGGAALKTLTIQLQPEDLGTLDVSMRLVDGRLSLEVSASRHATARLLSEDRGGLKKLLEQAGFALDDTAISIMARDASSVLPAARNAPAGSEGAQAGSGSQTGGGQSSAERSNEGSGRDPRSRREQPERPDPEPRRSTASVYL